MNAKIIIATHKKYYMPKDPMYLPLHVGAEGKMDPSGKPLDLGYTKDNTGDNISTKNPYFCELTGLYWAWKNLDADYIGLVHYRRHFSMHRKASFENILKYEEIKPYLGKIKLFVPKKRNYLIESLYSHYEHTHYIEQLDLTRTIIKEKYPQYVAAFDKVVCRRSGYMFNMAIMERHLLDKYCTWLFDILFELERRIDMPQLDAFQSRFYGRVSEIIFNVWLEYTVENKEIPKNAIMELNCIHLEKINWYKKGKAFLRAKFFGEKYQGSF